MRAETLFEDPHQAREQIQGWREQAARQGRAARRALTRMDDLAAEAWSPRREVRVVLNSAGLISDLEFAESAPTVSPAILARALNAAHRAALRVWQEQMDAIADEEYADQGALREAFKSAVEEAVPPPDDEDEQGSDR